MASSWLGNRQGFPSGASGFIAKHAKTSTKMCSFQALFKTNVIILIFPTSVLYIPGGAGFLPSTVVC